MGLTIDRVSNWSYKCARFHETVRVMREFVAYQRDATAIALRWVDWFKRWSENIAIPMDEYLMHVLTSCQSRKCNARVMKTVRPVGLFSCMNTILNWRSIATATVVWAAIIRVLVDPAATCTKLCISIGWCEGGGLVHKTKTLSGGSLGSCNEEEQSKLCDLLWIAERFDHKPLERTLRLLVDSSPVCLRVGCIIYRHVCEWRIVRCHGFHIICRRLCLAPY